MLQSEFEERFGRKVSTDLYAFVEEIYNDCKLDKDAFVKEYKEVSKKEVYQTVVTFLDRARADRKELMGSSKHFEKWYEEAKAKSRAKDIEMGEWLIRTSFETRDEKMQETLRLKARCIMGMKTYLAYMIENKNLCWLVDDERKELLAYLNGER